MPKFKLYAGLGSGLGGAHYCGTYEFKNQEEADRAAYELAWEKCESYSGHRGWITWYAKEVDPVLDWHGDDEDEDDDVDCFCD